MQEVMHHASALSAAPACTADAAFRKNMHCMMRCGLTACAACRANAWYTKRRLCKLTCQQPEAYCRCTACPSGRPPARPAARPAAPAAAAASPPSSASARCAPWALPAGDCTVWPPAQSHTMVLSHRPLMVYRTLLQGRPHTENPSKCQWDLQDS